MKKVVKGEKLAIRASDWNSVVNAAELVKNNTLIQRTGYGGSPAVEVMIRNDGVAAMTGFSAVRIDTLLLSDCAALVFSAVPAESGDDISGIVQQPVIPGELGSAVISGLSRGRVNVLDTSHEYAVPDGSGKLASAASGSCRMIGKSNSTGIQMKALLLRAGAQSDCAADGPFAATFDAALNLVNVASGYASCNGKFMTVRAAKLVPQNGIICVHAQLNANGGWSDPVLMFAEPDANHFPVGAVETTGGAVRCHSFNVPVAVILETAACPLGGAVSL